MRRKHKLWQMLSWRLTFFPVRKVGFNCICYKETLWWCHHICEWRTPYCETCKNGEEHFNIFWPQTDDISEIETEDVAAFLPELVEGRGGGMTFPVSFSGLHVCQNLCSICCYWVCLLYCKCAVHLWLQCIFLYFGLKFDIFRTLVFRFYNCSPVCT
jgi:hypothetical protein